MSRITDLWQALAQSLPPYFFGTLLSALFGTFVGAFVTSRVQGRKAVVEELNAINVASTLCFAVCNKAMTLKKQHVRELRQRYEQTRQSYLEASQANWGRTQGPLLVFQADLRALTPPHTPIELLQEQVLEKISIRGRGLVAAVELVTVLEGLRAALNVRNELVAEFQRASPMPDRQMAEKYLGLQTSAGYTDARFKDNIENISLLTDDSIFFSRVLAGDLLKYGQRFRRRNLRRLRFFLPKLDTAEWGEAERAGLIPPEEEYKNWLKGFRRRPTIYQRLRTWVWSLRARIVRRSV